jgi:hypothetical protein
MKEENSPSKALLDSIKALWEVYGGHKVFLRSPYLWFSSILALLLLTTANHKWIWYEKALTIIPNLIGFSLGGYAVMLAFGDKQFLNILRGPGDDDEFSPYLKASASLAWFVVIQIITLLVSVVFDTLQVKSCFMNYFGCWLFIYSIVLGLAATLNIFFLSKMYDAMPQSKEDKPNSSDSP